MRIGPIKKLAWKHAAAIIVLILVAFGVEKQLAREYAPDIKGLVEEYAEVSETTKPRIALVTYVHDGDTVTIDSGERVRLIGINAPEIGEPYATSSREYLAELVNGREIRYETDTTLRDRYDRILAYIFVDNVFVNEKMVEAGLAWEHAYQPDVARQDVLRAAEAQAQVSRVGVWSP